jgi:TRAP-type C4-dicarboxylate transport system permease large subunit
VIEPLIPNIVAGIHEAISISIANTFLAGIVAAVLAALLVLFLHEVPMRTTMEGGATLREGDAVGSSGGGIAAG